MTHFGARSSIDEFKYSIITQLFDPTDIGKFRDWVYKGHCSTIKKNSRVRIIPSGLHVII